MKRILTTFVLLLLLAVIAGVLYRMAVTQITADVYRERLQTLSQDYTKLATSYNEAVRKTAVTELLVGDGKMTVVIRDVQGVVKEIPTPYDPAREIYVDYIVVEGRLWIRRVYDENTPPNQGQVIEPMWEKVDWKDARFAVGKAVYRSLADGRWVVTVTGDGSLGLAKSDTDAPTPLSPPPPVRDYPQIEAEIQAELTEIGASEVLRRLVSAE